jgi:peptide/nickel transport system ATP-binding protein
LQESHNLAFIYITHDLSTVRYFSEFIFVMYAGEVVEFARMEDLLDDPKHPYTHALLDASSDPNADNALVMREIPKGEPPSLVNPPPACRFHPRCPHFMPGLCDVKEPPNFEVSPRHLVACWLYDKDVQESNLQSLSINNAV